MLDLKFVRENPDIVKQNIKNKFQDSKLPLVDEVIALDAENRTTQKEADDLRASRNKLSKQIGALMGQGKKEEAEEVIKKISLTDGTEQTVFSYTGTGASIDRGRSFGDKLYFVIREYTKNKETKAVSSDYKGLFEYDFATGDTRKVIDADVCDYHADTENQTLFYFVQGTGLYAYDMTQGSNTLIYPAEDELIQCKMSYDGKNLYLFNNGAGRATETKTRTQRYCYVLDTKGNQIAKILCNGVVYFGDTDYLFEENGDNLEYMKKENLSDKSEWIQVN